ncbi:inositol polyphosphate 5-phosphatase [Dissophora ornata]|nr:inositol polyphosphate 5-phosphatase [Dissophora ornata]
MQSEVYLSSHGQPSRTIALKPCAGTRFDSAVDQGHVLYFALHDQPAANGQSQVSVRLEPASEFHTGFYRKVHSRPVYGCLGLMHYAKDTFIAFVTGCIKLGDIRPGESVYRILAVKFFSLTGNTPDEDMIPAPHNPDTYYEGDDPTMMPHPAMKMQEKQDAETILHYDERFLWNMFMLKELLTFRSHLDEQEREELDSGGLLVHIIQGYVGCQSFKTATTQGQMSVISRLSSKRAGRRLLVEGLVTNFTSYHGAQCLLGRFIISHARHLYGSLGTRYNTRGIDDNGNVANFVEIRGSVPVFWEQQGLQLASHKIQLSRGAEATKPAVRRHFEELIQKYKDVHILDLLGTKDQGEVTLSQEYKSQVEDLGPLLKHVHTTKFDYHSQVKGGNYDQLQGLLNHVRGDCERYGYFYHDLISNTIVQTQRGVFRTNCLDCLDRTNVIQSNLSKEAVESLFHSLVPQGSRIGALMLMHSELWANNGDLLSKIYTGTGALKSEVTRSGKMSFASMLGDATKSLNRFVINNFQDKDRQEVIDILLGKMAHQSPVAIHDPVHDSIASEMSARMGEYSQKVQIDVFVGSYNLNGKLPSGESLDDWLHFDKDVPEPDMYVIGFQEIVKLTARQIAVTDENKRLIWEHEIENTINRRGGSRYVQLRSVQLVGAALMIYVKELNAPYIRNVECAIKKTGLKGMAGNKGAVAIRMDYYETSLCLVTSHLASGQENLQERNDDFHTIDGGIAFARGRNIMSHDIILWCGDFNYRVDMENDQIRALVSQGNYFEIFRCDQLKRSIDYGEAFYGYKEGIIAFAPTYRYDIGTDNYDTSEKYRAPAWTDRILYRGRGIYQTSYERAEFRTSDHRPVMSMFVLELTMLDSEAKGKMEEALYRKSSSKPISNGALKYKKDSGQELEGLLVSSERSRDISGLGYDRVSQSTGPKPSSDTHQWWNDPLEDVTKRIPSGNRNPFEGEQTTTRGENSKPLAFVPTPPAPSAKKPVIDLLGESGKFDAPVLSPVAASREGKTIESNGKNGPHSTGALDRSSSPPPLIKRNAPPPPVSRRTGIPVTTLPASSTLHKDGASRRPAPPPPPSKKNGVISASRADSDDDDGDDDIDDDDSNSEDNRRNFDVEDIPGKENGASSVTVMNSTSAKVEKNREVTDQETLLKPSELKKKQQQIPGASGPPIAASKKKDIGLIHPRLSDTSPISSPDTSAASSSLATAATNLTKVLLPGLDQQGPNKHQIGAASMGLGSAGGTTSNTSSALGHISDIGIDSGSGGVLQRTKEYNNKTESSTTRPITPSVSAPTTMSSSSLNTATSKATAYSIPKERDAAEEGDGVAISVSELKKGFVSSVANKSLASSTTSKPGGASSLSSVTASTRLADAPISNATTAAPVTPVIPMVKPLSFSTTRLPPPSVNPSKVKVVGLGSAPTASVLKNTGTEVQVQTQTPAESADVRPATGSVKQAIAALKGNAEGGAGDAATTTGTEVPEEEEKVDAFAFWKSK